MLPEHLRSWVLDGRPRASGWDRAAREHGAKLTTPAEEFVIFARSARLLFVQFFFVHLHRLRFLGPLEDTVTRSCLSAPGRGFRRRAVRRVLAGAAGAFFFSLSISSFEAFESASEDFGSVSGTSLPVSRKARRGRGLLVRFRPFLLKIAPEFISRLPRDVRRGV